ARALLRAFTYKAAAPAEILGEVNRFLRRDMPTGSFMTLHFAELNTKTGGLRYASAGHNPCFIFRKRRGSFEELDKTGPGLGILEEAVYRTVETEPLAPGDILFLYTDGLPEAMGPDRQLFGEERMKTLLAGLHERAPREIVNQMVRAVTDFTKRETFEDDLTLVVAKGT
ncbi:MAG TPA: PP2C family protein-serine/threonine phosphatase, partial [Vicinamibacteria bacterium]